MKKIVAILLCGTMIFASACKKKDGKKTKKTSETEVSETNGEPGKSREGVIEGKLNVDPKDADAGKYEIVLPLEPGNVQIQSCDFAYYYDGQENPAIASGSEIRVTATYKAAKGSTVTFYVLPVNGGFRWNIADAIASQEAMTQTAETDAATLQFTVTIPEGTYGKEYALVIAEGDTVICYAKHLILTNIGDSSID